MFQQADLFSTAPIPRPMSRRHDPGTSVTAERARAALCYEPITGFFTWHIRTSSSANPGEVAGYLMHNGYRRIQLDGEGYLAHRLAWLHVYGCWPADEIDHINGVKDDNRINNLREATRRLNNENLKRAPRSNRSSGLLGVTWRGDSQKWGAQITVDGRTRSLGRFTTAEAAHAAYVEAKRQYHHGCTL